jgi:hypothetical protein
MSSQARGAPDAAFYQRVKRVFLEARDREPAEREVYLASACLDDEHVLAEVRSLVAQADSVEGFLEAPALALAEEDFERAAPSDRPLPDRIGSFRILRILGWGGMGVVYLAEQDVPRRPVALKVLRADAAPLLLDRFRREQEVLGRLHHPGIAQIHSAGTADGEGGPQPYFVMEYVRGQPILEWADAQGLDARRRLRLMLRVCSAVEHAHAQGVVHRDLKPSNVLVDELGQPKILDFGVARLTSADDAIAGAPHTSPGQLVGTLAYMSPEQASGGSTPVDPRSDVYSLGVILYELLAGRSPYDLRGLPIHEALRVIREGDPIPLSVIRPELAGDVQTIVSTALNKDPGRRYRSAGSLREDLRRHLDSRTILARPPTRIELTLKLVRRHRQLALGLGVAFLALFAGLVASLVALQRAREAETGARMVRDAVLRLTDLERLDDLEAQVEDLWPARPERSGDLEEWLVIARRVASRFQQHRETLAVLRTRMDTADALERLAASPRDEQWLLGRQEELVARLERFIEPDLGLIAAIEARLAHARMLSDPGHHRDAWTAACAEIARLEPYRGLALEPQVGLVPVGRDATSGLWQFVVEEMTTDALALGREAGGALLLVLLPGGGEIQPFFLARHELTQRQWQRIGAVRSIRAPPSPELPVQAISWPEADRFARQLGLRLPTSAEWLYAARAAGELPDPSDHEPRVLRAVGQDSPNAFGLYDLLGSVWEWVDGGATIRRGGWSVEADADILPMVLEDERFGERSPIVGLRLARSVER